MTCILGLGQQRGFKKLKKIQGLFKEKMKFKDSP